MTVWKKPAPLETAATLVVYGPLRERGGIGRHAGFRFLCLTAWGFESPRSHPLPYRRRTPSGRFLALAATPLPHAASILSTRRSGSGRPARPLRYSSAAHVGEPPRRARRSRRCACAPSMPAAARGSPRRVRHAYRRNAAACGKTAEAAQRAGRYGGSPRLPGARSWACRPGPHHEALVSIRLSAARNRGRHRDRSASAPFQWRRDLLRRASASHRPGVLSVVPASRNQPRPLHLVHSYVAAFSEGAPKSCGRPERIFLSPSNQTVDLPRPRLTGSGATQGATAQGPQPRAPCAPGHACHAHRAPPRCA